MRFEELFNKRVKAWTRGVVFEQKAKDQVKNLLSLPFIYKWVAIMPDVHWGLGATVGSVIPTERAVIPAAVGVDIGCGMMAQKLSIKANDLPDNLKDIRQRIEEIVPVGFDKWGDKPPDLVSSTWQTLEKRFKQIVEKYPHVEKSNNYKHLGTLGGGNHFIEICVDEQDYIWIMLHSGSRGVGNVIGRNFIKAAKEDMRVHHINLRDEDLSYLSEGTKHFDDYIEAVGWAQDYARENRNIMMQHILEAIRPVLPEFSLLSSAVNCHHNYVTRENHFNRNVIISRKGAVSARKDEYGIIPGSMGARSYIVKGKGNPLSFHSCSHGAGRVMSRRKAKESFNVADQIEATKGVECKKDESVIDEIPMAYKDIDAVIEAQSDLIDVVHTLKQVVCVKG